MKNTHPVTRQHRTFAVLPLVLILPTLMAIAGCGGGSSGGGRSTVPVPPGTPSALGQTTPWRQNPYADDLLDHWDDTTALQDAVQTSPLDQDEGTGRLDTLRSLLQSPDQSRGTSQTLLRNVDVDSGRFTVIGSRDGITYGQWKAGPAGKLDIDFDYRFAPEFDAAARARMERAGKSWSWRLADDFGTNTVSARRIARSYTQDGVTAEEMVMTDDFTTDDMLIFVQQHDGTLRSQGGNSHRSRSARERNDYQAYAGFVRIGEHRFTRVPDRGDLSLTGIMAHEIGHVLGIAGGLADTQYFQDLVDDQASTFNGPNILWQRTVDQCRFNGLTAIAILSQWVPLALRRIVDTWGLAPPSWRTAVVKMTYTVRLNWTSGFWLISDTRFWSPAWRMSRRFTGSERGVVTVLGVQASNVRSAMRHRSADVWRISSSKTTCVQALTRSVSHPPRA